MINPSNVTNFNLTDPELEEYILFWVLAAGKTAKTAAKSLDKFLNTAQDPKSSPFDLIRCYIFWEHLSETELISKRMKECGIGCSTSKSITFRQLARSKLNLKTLFHLAVHWKTVLSFSPPSNITVLIIISLY